MTRPLRLSLMTCNSREPEKHHNECEHGDALKEVEERDRSDNL
jgi:hypothetical protein